MKRLSILLTTTFFVLSFAGAAMAVPVTLMDTTYFGPYGTYASEDLISYGGRYVNKIEGYGDHVKWKHNFTFDPAVASIKSAKLSLTFRDDYDRRWWETEWAYIRAEDGTWGLGEVDSRTYSFGVDFASLLDGMFAVKVKGLGGDFFIKQSKLTVNYHPVPEPGTLLLLGAGVVGLAIYRRRKA